MVNTLVFAGDRPSSTIRSALTRGDLVQVARGVYSTEADRDSADIVRSHWAEIVGRLFPDAVITDRSARTGGPVDGALYLAHPRKARDLELPGLRVRAREGAGPHPGDTPYAGGLHLASLPRGLAENSRPSRARSGAARTLDSAEIGDWVDYLAEHNTTETLTRMRAEAEEAAPALGVEPEHLRVVQSAIGVAIGTRDAEETPSESLKSRSSGKPVDQARIARFERLASALRSAAPQTNPEESTPGEPGRTCYLPFYEAYFSNFIEGTEFTVDEAADIVYEGTIPDGRPADAHDVTGTYRVVVDPEGMRRRGEDADEFIALMLRRHAAIMEGRPEKRPGRFKERANQAGDTFFVDPVLVEGTLRAGFRLRDDLDTAWERAVYTAFLVAEVHPFADGNGRTARVMMNAELAAAGESRIIIPTVFRQDYLDGLRAMSRRDSPDILIKGMRYAHDFTHSVDFHDFNEARELLEQAHAFDDPDSTRRLRILERRRPWEVAPRGITT